MVSEHANKVKFIDYDPHWYTRRVQRNFSNLAAFPHEDDVVVQSKIFEFIIFKFTSALVAFWFLTDEITHSTYANSAHFFPIATTTT